jgi:hypothetical protein
MLQRSVAKKILTAALAETNFNYLTRAVNIGDRKIAQPIIGIQTIAPSGTASAVAFTSVWFTRSTIGTTHEKN